MILKIVKFVKQGTSNSLWRKNSDNELPTVLVYGHYDVQPIDPVELWDSSPFEPQIKKTQIHPEGAIFARGLVMIKDKCSCILRRLRL